ncbi:hypothetical protein GCM10010222_24130 [Streptomyces tanashiensis]|nr:hypothetical protein GCM10010222_24130 [Streptomyces tanashiensis]
MSVIRRDWSARLGKQEAYGTHGARVPQGPSGPHRRSTERRGCEGGAEDRGTKKAGHPIRVTRLLICGAKEN